MKIATPHCGFSPETNSGGETYEREILKNLAKLGAEFEVILAKGKRYPEGFPQFHVHHLPVEKGLRWYVSNWIWPHYLKRIEKSCGFDLLRIHSLRFTGPGVLWFNRMSQKKYPVVCHHHHIDPDPLNPFIEKKVIEKSDLLITGSEFSKRQLVETFKTNPTKIKVVPYGIDETFAPQEKDEAYKKELGLKNEKILLFLAGLKKRKKVFFLIDTFQELLRHYRDPVKLIIAGSGPLKKKLQEYALSKNLGGKILFTGFVPEDRKLTLYNLCDTFVFPSDMEGFGFSPAEAMACGKPVVCSDAGSLPEIVEDGQSGFCVPNKVPAFVEKILTLLNDGEMRRRFGSAGEMRARTIFQWPIVAQRTLEAYQALLDNRRES